MHLKSYIEPKFSWGWVGGQSFSTEIQEMGNGAEKRRGRWVYGRHRFRLNFSHLTREMFLSLKGHHGVCRGMLHGFLFLDWQDYEAVDELFGTGDGTTTVFQLTKITTRDGYPYRRLVTALYQPGPSGTAVQVNPTITVNNVAEAGVTFDHDRATVTFSSPPAVDAALRWSAPYFSMWVRYNRDELPFAFDQPEGLYGDVELIEIKPPVSVP